MYIINIQIHCHKIDAVIEAERFEEPKYSNLTSSEKSKKNQAENQNKFTI